MLVGGIADGLRRPLVSRLIFVSDRDVLDKTGTSLRLWTVTPSLKRVRIVNRGEGRAQARTSALRLAEFLRVSTRSKFLLNRTVVEHVET